MRHIEVSDVICDWLSRDYDPRYQQNLNGSGASCALTAVATLKPTSEIIYICMAADLLRHVMMEVQRAEARCLDGAG
jgi:hypothetical protein